MRVATHTFPISKIGQSPICDNKAFNRITKWCLNPEIAVYTNTARVEDSSECTVDIALHSATGEC